VTSQRERDIARGERTIRQLQQDEKEGMLVGAALGYIIGDLLFGSASVPPYEPYEPYEREETHVSDGKYHLIADGRIKLFTPYWEK
jgi:hypothetical protein